MFFFIIYSGSQAGPEIRLLPLSFVLYLKSSTLGYNISSLHFAISFLIHLGIDRSPMGWSSIEVISIVIRNFLFSFIYFRSHYLAIHSLGESRLGVNMAGFAVTQRYTKACSNLGGILFFCCPNTAAMNRLKSARLNHWSWGVILNCHWAS